MLGAALLLTLALVVEPAGGCPSAAQIEAQLRALEAPTAPGPPLLVRVTRAGDHLHLSLRDGSGAERAARFNTRPETINCQPCRPCRRTVRGQSLSCQPHNPPSENYPGCNRAIRFVQK